jgi:hypothetical protein
MRLTRAEGDKILSLPMGLYSNLFDFVEEGIRQRRIMSDGRN